MTKIRFHRLINEKWPRYHTTWFTKFIDYLSEHFIVEVLNHGSSEKNPSKAKLLSENLVFKNEVPISDVDCIIENVDNQEYVALSFTEYFNNIVVHYLRSDKCKKILLAHFNSTYLFDRLKRDNLVNKCEIVKPWFFPFAADYDVNFYRTLRSETIKNNKLFFRGSGVSTESYRASVFHLLDEEFFLGGRGIEFNQYMSEMSESTIGLSHYMDLNKYTTPFDHTGELCYRDVEYLSIGLPFIRIEYRDSLYNNLIPGHHYISIPREKAYDAYKNGGDKAVANLYKETFLKFKDENEYLNFISKNQIEWFDSNVAWPASADLTWNLLNLEIWKK